MPSSSGLKLWVTCSAATGSLLTGKMVVLESRLDPNDEATEIALEIHPSLRIGRESGTGHRMNSCNFQNN